MLQCFDSNSTGVCSLVELTSCRVLWSYYDISGSEADMCARKLSLIFDLFVS